jgi:Global regulator protein family
MLVLSRKRGERIVIGARIGDDHKRSGSHSLSKRNEPGNHPGPLTVGLSTQPLTRSATPPSLRHSPC